MSNNIEELRLSGIRYGGYEDPKGFEPYHLFLLGMDFVFNWVMDWAHTDPLTILVIFIFQVLCLIVNLIVYIMASGSQAMQIGLRKSIIYHHEIHLITSLLYISLTCSWYVWALRKSWPADVLSFTFSSYSPTPEITVSSHDDYFNTTTTTTTSTVSPSMETYMANLTTTLSTLASTLNAINTSSGSAAAISTAADNFTNTTTTTMKSRSFSFVRNLFLPKLSKNKGILDTGIPKGNSNSTSSSVREFYTLWSSGFVALYTVQRTVAIIHYLVSLKATFLVLNTSTIDKFDGTLKSDRMGKRIRISASPETLSVSGANALRITSTSEGEREMSGELDRGMGSGWENFRNDKPLRLWQKKAANSANQAKKENRE